MVSYWKKIEKIIGTRSGTSLTNTLYVEETLEWVMGSDWKNLEDQSRTSLGDHTAALSIILVTA